MAVALRQLTTRVEARISFSKIFLFAVVAVTLYLVLIPLIFLLWNSFHGAPSPMDAGPLTLNNYIKAYINPSTYTMLLNTLWFALGSVVIGVGLGVAFAWLIERTNVPWKNLWYTLIPLPMTIPGMLLAISWVLLLSPRIGVINLVIMNIFGLEKSPLNIYSMGGMFFVEGLRMVPTMFLMMIGAFRSMDPSLEEAGATSGAGILSTLRRVTGPIMLPAILSAVIYSFTIAIEAFDIPGIIGITGGIPVFSTKIYLASRLIPANYSLAAAFSVFFVVISVFLMMLYSRMTRKAEKYSTITGKGYRSRVINLGSWRYAGLAFILIYLLLALVFPGAILLWASLLPFYSVPGLDHLKQISLSAYQSLLSYPNIWSAFKNTLIMMATVATSVTLLGSLIAWIVVRSRSKGRKLLDMVSFLPMGVPSIVIGLALILVYLKMDFIPIYNTIWILVMAYVIRLITFPSRTMNASMLQIHKELEEAASVNGAGWWAMFTRITTPLLTPAMVSVWVWAALTSMREVSSALMLSGPNSTVLSVVVWNQWTDGGIPQSAALGIIMLALGALIMFLGRFIGFKVAHRGKM